MAMYVYVWICRAMYGYVHVGHVCLCITILCIAMYGYVWLCTAM